jgi:UPF0716 protein FxsA
MRLPFSLVFLLLVLAEIAVFIRVGEAIGVLATLGLTLFAMVAGALLLRYHGVATLVRVRAEIEAGRTPAPALAEGAVLAAAAFLLIVPGFITDAAGALLFVPPVRRMLWRAIRRSVRIRTALPRTEKARGLVVDLERSEYGTRPRSDSPWRPDRGR